MQGCLEVLAKTDAKPGSNTSASEASITGWTLTQAMVKIALTTTNSCAQVFEVFKLNGD